MRAENQVTWITFQYYAGIRHDQNIEKIQKASVRMTRPGLYSNTTIMSLSQDPDTFIHRKTNCFYLHVIEWDVEVRNATLLKLNLADTGMSRNLWNFVDAVFFLGFQSRLLLIFFNITNFLDRRMVYEGRRRLYNIAFVIL